MTMIDSDFSARAGRRNAMAKVFGEEGICIDLRLRPDELDELRRLTTLSWLGTIAQAAPDKVDEFRKVGMEQYHTLAHLLDHSHLWSTTTRTYSADMVDALRAFSLFDALDAELPPYRISSYMPPYGDFGRPRVNWRLCRPGAGVDIGPIHADYWFEAVLDAWSGAPSDLVRLKIWIPIYLEEGVTGFAYVPHSHLEDYEFQRKPLRSGGFKPDFAESGLLRPLETLSTPCGTAVMFNYNLVHRGANSERATRTRVSMELTLDIPRGAMEERYGSMARYW